MRAVTHNIFSLGLNIFLLSRTGNLSAVWLLVALWLAFAVNAWIDFLGHTRKNDIPVRSFVTHSVFLAPLWGTLVGFVTVIVPCSIFSLPAYPGIVFIGIGLGMSVSSSHLLLDALTGAGVYLGRRRIAIAHTRYDNPPLNFAFIGAGLLLLSVAIVS